VEGKRIVGLVHYDAIREEAGRVDSGPDGVDSVLLFLFNLLL
jgi:hypothetical protein